MRNKNRMNELWTYASRQGRGGGQFSGFTTNAPTLFVPRSTGRGDKTINSQALRRNQNASMLQIHIAAHASRCS